MFNTGQSASVKVLAHRLTGEGYSQGYKGGDEMNLPCIEDLDEDSRHQGC